MIGIKEKQMDTVFIYISKKRKTTDSHTNIFRATWI